MIYSTEAVGNSKVVKVYVVLWVSRKNGWIFNFKVLDGINVEQLDMIYSNDLFLFSQFIYEQNFEMVSKTWSLQLVQNITNRVSLKAKNLF